MAPIKASIPAEPYRYTTGKGSVTEPITIAMRKVITIIAAIVIMSRMPNFFFTVCSIPEPSYNKIAVWLALTNHTAILQQFASANYSEGKDKLRKQPKS
ncbi:hypothetical protein CLOSTASPAR_03438 [[Clostridium] asparagiforme DSM 15981]|uniref:Uncharacterized protein n=1 Tax=[Clostridium] asparagiforme DSM 15981 TaxID=518636 RepID=C0D2E9_9FIRM|nr:hypothetical protein CLOSTASPAR_03438 [[Clostridium] asparagiforme DSM 15981]